MIPCEQSSMLERLEKKIDKISTDVEELKGFKFKVVGAFSVISVIAIAGWQVLMRFL